VILVEFRPKISMRRSHAMAAGPSIDVSGWLEEQLAQASPDLLRAMVSTFVQALMGAEADAVCGAAYGERSGERTNTRNGYRRREWDTRAGSIGLAIPKLRHGSYFPAWLLERRRRTEAALVTVVATSYLLGVSTRRMEKLVETLGITRLSKSQVSEMAKDLDAQVEAFRTRPLDAGPYTFAAADALVLKVREGGGSPACTPCWPPASTPMATGRSWACTSPPARMAPGGWRSSGIWPLAACPESPWSPPMRTAG
jgi:Transposase, Mutator family